MSEVGSRVSDPDPHGSALIWAVGSGSGSAYKLLIRIQEGKNDPKNREKDRIFIFWSAGCSLLRDEGFSCSLGVLYGGLGIGKLQFLIKKKKIRFLAVIFFQFLIIKPWIRIRDPYPESGSAIRKNAGSGSVSGSALNQCGSETLVGSPSVSTGTAHICVRYCSWKSVFCNACCWAGWAKPTLWRWVSPALTSQTWATGANIPYSRTHRQKSGWIQVSGAPCYGMQGKYPCPFCECEWRNFFPSFPRYCDYANFQQVLAKCKCSRKMWAKFQFPRTRGKIVFSSWRNFVRSRTLLLYKTHMTLYVTPSYFVQKWK